MPDCYQQVQIILSTYNGEQFVKELLDSLLGQNYPNFTILIRDDGSIDNTINILQAYKKKYSQIKLITGKNIGFVQSFFKLLKMVDNQVDYIGFCDQDDVWLPDKISQGIQLLSQQDQNFPTLYCSRLKLVDKNLNWLSDSIIPAKKLTFNNALVECSVIGCTLFFNRKGYDLLTKYPQNAIGHDWWLYLVFSAFGNIIYDPIPQILYRQHQQNTFGLSNNFLINLQVKINRFLTMGKNQPVRKQAEDFAQIYLDKLNTEQQVIIQQFLNYQTQSFLQRCYSIFALKNELYRQSKFDNSILKLLLLFQRL